MTASPDRAGLRIDRAEALTAELLGVEGSLAQAAERLKGAIHITAALAATGDSEGPLDVERLVTEARENVRQAVDDHRSSAAWGRGAEAAIEWFAARLSSKEADHD